MALFNENRQGVSGGLGMVIKWLAGADSFKKRNKAKFKGAGSYPCEN